MQSRGNALIVGDAIVEINGSRVASLGRSESYIGDIKPGPATIAVSSLLIPGRYVVNFKAEEGKKYRFSVVPRGDSGRTLNGNFIVTEAAGTYKLGSSD